MVSACLIKFLPKSPNATHALVLAPRGVPGAHGWAPAAAKRFVRTGFCVLAICLTRPFHVSIRQTLHTHYFERPWAVRDHQTLHTQWFPHARVLSVHQTHDTQWFRPPEAAKRYIYNGFRALDFTMRLTACKNLAETLATATCRAPAATKRYTRNDFRSRTWPQPAAVSISKDHRPPEGRA